MAEPLRAGDVVRVRTKEEILATLDETGRLGALPFMPEMLAFTGQELTVFKRADKTCDTITQTGTRRRMENTVHLVGARCDGSAHGGCQAGCLLFFREEWLSSGPEPATGGGKATIETLYDDTRQGSDADGEPLYRCQTTELLAASSGGLSPYDWGQYVTDVRTGNERLTTVLAGILIMFFNMFQRRTHRLPRWARIRDGEEYPFLRGTAHETVSGESLDLKPGELVEVRSKAEIEATLRPTNKNRGMVFDAEMLPFCGRRARVKQRVDRIIDEPTGRMIELRDCLILEEVYCKALYHRFCPRSIYPYWREVWLKRVDEPQGPSV